MRKPYHLPQGFWDRLPQDHRALYLRVRPLAQASYSVDCPINRLDAWLESTRQAMQETGGSFDLCPDFQRGHVWSELQQARYIESLLRKAAPVSILFNCPHWVGSAKSEEGDIAPYTFECIDGLQRLTAVRKFMEGEVRVFDGLSSQDLLDTPFDPRRYTIKTVVYEFTAREDLLQFYLDLNAGGTAHSEQEIERVRALQQSATRMRAGLASEDTIERPRG